MNIKECENLTNFLLDVLRPRSGMFLGKKGINNLITFITGYQIAENINDCGIDSCFGKNGFNTWFMKLKGYESLSSITTPFMDESNNDEQKALDLYFEYLEKYRANLAHPKNL